MRYLDTNVSDWFRDELADLIVAVLRDEGAMAKGSLIGKVMRRRGLEPNQGNMRMRAHIDEMERRGVLVSQRALTERHSIIISLADAAEGGDRAILPEDVPGAPRDTEDRRIAETRRPASFSVS